MKKNYLIFSMLAGMLITFTGYSQSYSAYGTTPSNDNYNYIDNSNDTMYYTFNSLSNGAYEDAILTIDGNGYFQPGSSYNIYGPGSVLVGNFTRADFNTCGNFTTTVTIPLADINTYGTSVIFKFVKQGNVYPYCNANRLRAKLQYNYCTTGVPTQQAYFAFTTDSLFCQSEGPFNLAGIPAGGSFYGNGISGNVLDVSALPSGIHTVTYRFTEATGCYTEDSTTFMIIENPIDQSFTVCENTVPVLNTGNIATVYASNESLSSLIGSGTNVTLNPITSSPTEIFSAVVSSPFYYQINSLDTTNHQIIDHDPITGDDRGGIAVTANYVYIVGDDATGRFDLDLQNGIDLPIRDGIFTDLAQLKLYTLYSTTSPFVPDSDNFDYFTMNALRSLNEDLSYGNEIILLSQPITIGTADQALILAGYNELIVGTANGNYDFYHISILNGLVTPMGQHDLEVQGSENWADWGMSGFDGTNRHGYFRDSNDSLVDYNFSVDTTITILSISDFSDMASFIAHPINHRFYGHYEGSTTTFGGNNESLFYFQISDTASRLAATAANYGCPTKITFTFNSIDLGADTTVCSEDGLYIIPGGFGYNSYTWNGVNNNFNSYAVQTSGEVVLSVVDEANCTLTDSVNVTITACTNGITELLGEASMQAYPVPNNGTFQVSFNAFASEAQMSIVDTQGKHIENRVVKQGETTVDLNLNVQPGIYFVRLVSETETLQRAISIQ
ncbi:T9SS type A sorting domain-containing protein [Fluviicola chungangensis]|uniref:T9SS type A sorting domain-containing protein n=1 Tax=Fluviicola chungangensis TaxID=2597671 RepID=A0A556MMM6_9FLAO|nr:T9SS type A sorting domain-containing protein [Fluviicola chungangensis]TSJ41173.1 T9SS type A sorting domain-containing protein [Fluviicola chungangensis]